MFTDGSEKPDEGVVWQLYPPSIVENSTLLVSLITVAYVHWRASSYPFSP